MFPCLPFSEYSGICIFLDEVRFVLQWQKIAKCLITILIFNAMMPSTHEYRWLQTPHVQNWHWNFTHDFVTSSFKQNLRIVENLPWRVCCDDDDRKGRSSGQCKAPGMTVQFNFSTIAFFIKSFTFVWETFHQEHFCEIKIYTVQ